MKKSNWPRQAIVLIGMPALFVILLAVFAAVSPAIASPQSQTETADATGAGKAEVGAGDSLELASSSPGKMSESESSDEDSQSTVDLSGGGMRLVSKSTILVGSLTVFLLAIFVGFEVITKVPPTLHTPLMSGSNAISGITVVGAMLTAGHAAGGFGSLLGLLAVVLATINVVGGFLVTHRMLMMFKKR